ncbi:hypothetical protein D3C87_1712530 [compost metagenome]
MAIAGPTTNKNLLGVFGSNSSFENNFIPSASGCNKPPQPARLGPTRSCKKAATLRSAQVEYIAIIIVMAKTTTITTLFSIINVLSIFNRFDH